MPVVSASDSESESTETVLTLSKGTSSWTVITCCKVRDSIKDKIPGMTNFIAVQNAWTAKFKSSALVHALHDRYGYPKVLDFGKSVAWIIPNVDPKEYKKALRAVAVDVVPNWSFKVTFKEKDGYKLTKQSLDKLIAELADDDTSDSNEASSESSSEEKPATPPEEKPATPPAQRKQKRPRPSPSSASSAATRIVVDSSDEEKEATTPLTAKAKGKRPARPASLILTEAEEENSDEDGETGGASSSTSRAPRSSKSVYRRR